VTARFDTPVLIAGGGPVGLSLGMDLAWQGTECMVVEQRTERTAHPKATLLGSRSMEQLRRFGLEEEIYSKSLPNDLTYRISFATGMNGDLLMRFESPSINMIKERNPEYAKRWAELNWSPYGKTQIGQQAVEPILMERAYRMPKLTIQEGWRVASFVQDAEGVTSQLENVKTGETRSVRSKYLVGCDGGASVVRKALGIRFAGRGAMRPNVTFLFRSKEFAESHPLGPGNLFYILLPDTFGVFMSIDGKDLWGYQYYYLDPSQKTETPDVEAILHRAVGKPFAFELLNITHWQHHQSVASHYQAGRVFLAGDAAHLFSPTGGVGMNTGINDAFDLSWKLHATLEGWAGHWLLHSYEQERRPIAIRNTQRAASNSDKNDMIMAEVTGDTVADTPRGALLRAGLKQKLRWVVGQYESAGVHLGYRYQKSEICVAEPGLEPPDDYRVVTQSTFPGFRAPHVWMSDGRSTLDLYGRGFVLMNLAGSAEDSARFTQAFNAQNVPLTVHHIQEPDVVKAYERALVLVRPDGHVAWRGDSAPDDLQVIVERARGAVRPTYAPEWATPEQFSSLAISPTASQE
jgi:2-polyprenyl-6-methoxyphenol hydroxylase-like FAD-dependent oxidoreductase